MKVNKGLVGSDGNFTYQFCLCQDRIYRFGHFVYLIEVM